MEFNKMFVSGAGFMGSGIAQTALQFGFDVVLYDIDMALVEKAKTGIENMFKKNVAKNKMTEDEMQNALQRLTLCNDLNKAAGANIVIEAVVENIGVKKRNFSQAV